MNSLHPLIIVAVAALIHASFQLSISMQTLLSGHAIGARRSQAALVRLSGSFALGVLTMTTLCLSFATYLTQTLVGETIPLFVWSVICGLVIGLAIAVWSLYYRREAGTTLWIPRGVARYLTSRTKATKTSPEAFSLGLSSVVAELLFIATPVVLGGLALTQLAPNLQLLGLILYVIIATFPLLIVTALVSGGHKLSSIQRWREANKNFLQFAASAGLLILGFYVYVDQITAASVYAVGGF